MSIFVHTCMHRSMYSKILHACKNIEVKLCNVCPCVCPDMCVSRHMCVHVHMCGHTHGHTCMYNNIQYEWTPSSLKITF
jgi:hypothetical protein